LQELDQALSALHQTLETHPPLEICRRVEHILAKLEQSPPPHYLRPLRAVEALEHIGTSEACEVLATLARGAPLARLTQAAQQAQQRLGKRSAPLSGPTAAAVARHTAAANRADKSVRPRSPAMRRSRPAGCWSRAVCTPVRPE